MSQLVIPRTLDFESVQVLESLARLVAERRAAGIHVLDFSPNELAAAADRTVSQIKECGAHTWRGTEPAAYRNLLQLAAVAIEMSEAIARAAEFSAAPRNKIPSHLNGGRQGGGPRSSAAIEDSPLPCDCEPAT